MEPFETSKPDRLHQSLSSAWASFLGAQHCSREVDSLKKVLDQHVQQTNLSITSLQRDTATRHDLAASVTEAKSKIEQHAVEIRDIATLRSDFSTFQYEVAQNKDNVARKVTDLFDKAVAQQESMDGLRSTTSHDLGTIREQYRSALEKVEALQQDLEEARAERLISKHKLAALESQITAMSQTHQQLPTDVVNFLGEIHSYREDLMRLLDKQDLESPAQSLAPPLNQTSIPLAQIPVTPYASVPYEQTLAPIVHRDQHDTSEDDRPHTRSKRRRLEDPPQPQVRRPVSPQAPSQDMRSLYLVFRDKYKENPPKSDTVFIWQFINNIEDPAMSRHIQESLVIILSEYVKPSRDKRCKNPLKLVDISKKLTWRMFREALVKIPGPS